MKEAPKKMAPPPPGAHEGERTFGVGLGVIVGALLGLAIGACTLLIFVLVRRDAVDQAVEDSQQAVEQQNTPIETPRPTVLPDESSRRTTDTTPSVTVTEPAVLQSSPQDGATAVPDDAEIVLTFASDMDESTLNALSVSVFDARRGSNIVSELSLNYREDSRQLTISLPAQSSWGSGNTIDVEVSTLAEDVNGRALPAPFRMTFSTR